MQNTTRQLAGDFHLAFPCDFGAIPELDRVKLQLVWLPD